VLSIPEAFNGTIISAAVCAAYELGLLDELHDRGSVDIAQFTADRQLDKLVVTEVLRALTYADIVVLPWPTDDGKAAPGSAFGELWRHKGYFLWLFGGYGELISTAAEQCRCLGSGVRKFDRNGAAIAAAAGDYGREFVDAAFEKVVDEFPFGQAADIGCGNASRIIRLARLRPDCEFIGIEIDPQAVEMARANVDEAGLADRIRIIHGDAEALPANGFSRVQLVFSFFMGHDFWPLPRCLETLNIIRSSFPDVQRFLLSDTYKSGAGDSKEPPIFTLGFEFTHALMGTNVPTLAEWKSAFAQSVWDLTGTSELGIANSVIFDLRPSPAG
jgi:phenylpyruvate C(3)-methyltransferase